jgi:hypothetical protein
LWKVEQTTPEQTALDLRVVERVFLVPAAWKLPAVAPTTPEQMAFELWVVGQTTPEQTALD